MELQALETFIKTAELLHFGRASRACNLSPSALTRTIQRLEQEVGHPLFLRDNRSVALTEAGARLLAYARGAVMDWQQFREALAPAAAVAGTLSLYASVTAVYSLLPDLLEAYRAAYPDVQLELRTGAAEKAIEQVQNGEIDLAVAALPDQKPARLEFLPLAETPLVFIAPSSARKRAVELSLAPLVVPQSGVARSRLDRWLRDEGIAPNVSVEVSGNEALIAMVRLGAGIGIVPRLAVERSPFRDDVLILPGMPKLAPYVVGLCSSTRNLKRPPIAALWKLAQSLG
jgi:LysR family positive regulator for ilvC